MSKRKQIDGQKSQLAELKKLPPELRPRLRIFLSADIVGSTALKQAERFPLSEPNDASTLNGISPQWFSHISDFYSDFSARFESSWAKWDSDADFGESSEAPQLWKANGDELIFVKELTDRLDLFKTIFAWRSAIEDYSKDKSSVRRLGVKSTIWVAGFPLTNSEIVFSSDLKEAESAYAGDPRLRSLHNLSRWYSTKNKKKQYVRDFIGPQIDVGFRLTTQSTIRFSVISLEVVYLLATGSLPIKKGKQFSDLKITYLGKKELKGVLGGAGYPIFAMDLKDLLLPNDHDFDEEEKITRAPTYPPDEQISTFCKKFYDVKGGYIFPPFMIECAYEHTELPYKYYENLKFWSARWERERNRTASDDRGDALGKDNAQAISDSEVDITELKKLLPPTAP